MDFQQNVNDTNDFERRSPPAEQMQSGNNDFFPDFDVTSDSNTHFFDLDYDGGNGGTDTIYTDLPYNEEGAFVLQAYSQVTSGANAHGNSEPASGSGYHHPYSATVNAYEYPNFYGNDFRNLEISHEEQANFNFDASDQFTNQLFHQDPPLFGSGDLSDHHFPVFPFNVDTHAANTVSLPAHSSGALTSPIMNEHTAQPTLPSTSPPMDSSRRTRRRRAASMDSRDTPEPSRVKKQCAGCDKAFYTSKDPDGLRCTRCYDKHVKHTAGHTTYVFDPGMTIDHAWRRLYPEVETLALAGDDVVAAKASEQDYIRRLIEAVSIPYTSDGSGTKEDQQRVAQQAKLNKKPFDSTQYRDDLVNARILFLFHIAHSYHAGGPSLYDTGGDNSGYGEDRTMKFSERMERIIQLLRFDKDIAMDVIEGRGVTALVHNPNKYERRKRDNKKSNDTKQDLQEKGKQLHMLEASASPAPQVEPALGQRVNLQTHFEGSHGNYAPGPHASTSAHPSFSGLRTPGFSSSLPSGGDGRNDGTIADMGELEGYVPARFG